MSEACKKLAATVVLTMLFQIVKRFELTRLPHGHPRPPPNHLIWWYFHAILPRSKQSYRYVPDGTYLLWITQVGQAFLVLLLLQEAGFASTSTGWTKQ